MISELDSDNPNSNISDPQNFQAPSDIELVNGNKIPYLGSDGEEAQSNSNPRAEFDNHSILIRNGKLFDPSYGTLNQSQKDWESNSVDGYGIKCELFIPAEASSQGVMIRRNVIYVYSNEEEAIQTSLLLN